MPLYFKTRRKRKWLRRVVAIFFVLLAMLTVTVWAFEKIYAARIYPGVRIGPYNLGGRTQEEARSAIQQLIDQISKSGLNFVYQDKRVSVNPVISSPTDPDLSYEILVFNLEESLTNIYRVGRDDNWFYNLYQQGQGLLSRLEVKAIYQLDKTELKDILRENFNSLEKPAEDARLEIQNGVANAIPETLGVVFDYDKAIAEVEQSIQGLEIKPIPLSLVTDYPKIRIEDTKDAISSAQKILETGPVVLKYAQKWWRIHPEQYGQWLEFVRGSDVTLGLNKDLVVKQLTTIAEEVNIKSQDAKFKMNDDATRVIEFQSSAEGRALNLEESYKKITQEIINNGSKEIELAVDIISPEVVEGDLNSLGIRELIGQGVSDFKGSPPNRIHNIKTGVKQLNGILIKPEEEFSLVKALGRIDAEAGYKPELVIKGNRTIPEYGGGLCQIGTTTFRVALRAGLPILERQAHSYRVSYYEPAGMDATIYPPHPDLKFKNDTGHHILFQTRIEGTKLIFEFYGTKDGRQVELSPEPPQIYNLRKPGPTKIIETEDLAPGEKKCTESSHVGADTEFTYKVTSANGEIKEEVFKSRYIPWQAVCLVGKKAAEKEATEKDTE